MSIQLVQPIRCIFHGIQVSNLHHKSIRPMNQSSFIFSWLVFLWRGGGKRVKNSWTLSISSLGWRHNNLRPVWTSLQNLPTLKTSFAPSNYEKNKKGSKKTCFFQKNCFFPLKKTRLKKTCFLPIPSYHQVLYIGLFVSFNLEIAGVLLPPSALHRFICII